jgi:two-component system, sensor histidine kinase PdtaS
MARILILIYTVTAALWILLTLKTGHSSHEAGLYLQMVLFIVPFLGSIFGIRNAESWGGLKSAVGKAVMFLSLGTLTWSLGMLAWNYYIFIAMVEVPYPSLADVFFILSWPLWALGVFFLSKATGVKFALRQAKGKAIIVAVPLLAAAASYYLLVVVARGGVLELDGTNGWKLFFDLFYPIGTAVILAMALTFFSLSMDFLGGLYKKPITILILGFIVNYLADFTFSLTTTSGTYFNGHFVDMLFLTAMYFIALSLSIMSPKLKAAAA